MGVWFGFVRVCSGVRVCLNATLAIIKIVSYETILFPRFRRLVGGKFIYKCSRLRAECKFSFLARFVSPSITGDGREKSTYEFGNLKLD